MSLTIRSVTRQDYDQWLPLWDGYNAFYGRSGPTALSGEITRVTWQRFFDAYEPVHALGACPNSRCSILNESDSTLGDEQVFSPLEYRSDAASAAECAGLRAERPCLTVYR
jgi:hypothetical protein